MDEAPAVGSRTVGDLPGGNVWTIGHWTCPESEFLRPLDEQRIDLLADVRALPGSRRSPHFDRDEMQRWLRDAGIDYVHLPELGGRRGRQQVDQNVNAGWRQPSFKNYADYTLGPLYRRASDNCSGWPVPTASRSCVVNRCRGAATAFSSRTPSPPGAGRYGI